MTNQIAPTIDPKKPLKNLRQEAFCQHYAGDCWGNASEAYRRSGYLGVKNANVHGAQLMANRIVQARIRALRDMAVDNLGWDRLRSLQKRLQIVDTAEPVDQLRAAEQLDRALGIFGAAPAEERSAGAAGGVTVNVGVAVQSQVSADVEDRVAKLIEAIQKARAPAPAPAPAAEVVP